MRLTSTVGRLTAVPALYSAFASAYPTADNLARLVGADVDLSSDILGELRHIQQKRLLFDPLTEPIDVSGEHEFQPPDFENGDQRGPCPGLNALANHGYLPRNGVAGFLEIVQATNTIFGMGVELSTVLSVMGTVGVGNPLSLDPGFSIGGETSESNNVLGNLLGLMGTPRGLAGSHNWIEGDASNTRDDLYVTGDAATMNMTLFREVYDAIEEKGGSINMDDIGDRAAKRYDDSVATNPEFYYGPYTGLVARNAAYLFTGRLLSNHSAEHPQGGNMTKEVFSSFWAVTEDSHGNLKYNRGWERIPSNWYRISVEYGLVPLNLDLIRWVTQHPKLANVGGNMGAVDTFAGVDLSDVSGGLLNAGRLLEGNNLLCFALGTVKTFAPGSLSTLFKTLEAPLKLVTDAVAAPLLSLSCPAYEDLAANGNDLMAKLKSYPGVKDSFAL